MKNVQTCQKFKNEIEFTCDMSIRRRGGLMSNYYHAMLIINIDVIANGNWCSIGVYKWNEEFQEHMNYALIAQLKRKSSLPQVCGREFNEVHHKEEKVRGNVKDRI